MGQISVILTVYNKEDYIENCLASLLNQTYRDFEIILIDDASTDESRAIIQGYTDPRLKIHHLETNVGVAKARNIGIGYASGDYIYFVDGDDYLAPYTLELFIQNIGDSPLIGGSIFKGGKVEISLDIGEDSYNLRELRGGKKVKALRRRSSVNFLIRKDYVEEIGRAHV